MHLLKDSSNFIQAEGFTAVGVSQKKHLFTDYIGKVLFPQTYIQF